MKGEKMAGVPKIIREDIVLASLQIVEEKGIDGLNARDIAKRLNCSIQPIFYQFKSMEDLKKAIYEKIYEMYKEYMLSGEYSDTPYKSMGNSYVNFAKEHKELFKILFMQKSEMSSNNFFEIDHLGDKVIEIGREYTGLDLESQKEFHLKVWIFTHGIATLIATETLKLTDLEIDKIIADSIREMLKGYKMEKGEI